MMITWVEYPDDKARKAGTGGVKRRGQVWCEGPSPGTRWVVPEDSATGLFVLVTTRNVPAKGKVIAENWSVAA